MGRPRNPERDNSMQRFLDSDGQMGTAELAKLAGVPEVRIRKWKSEDKWEEALQNKPKKRGGQKGNKNAAGKTPAKDGNKNAVTHGAFAQAGYGDIDPEQATQIQNMGTPSAMGQMMEELQALYLRKAYLEKLLKEYESEEAGGFYTDKIVHMIVPKSLEDREAEQDLGIESSTTDPEGSTNEQFKTAMKSIIKSSPFERAMKVEAELNKLHGRIIKQLDSIKAYELEDRRLTLQEKQYELQKQRLTGEIDINPEGSSEDTEVMEVID
ncbi:MAG: hypothetical protein KBS60_05475, partial [Phascolarctobacterium sp.]|nr:hypothetical protein [Candidatus Phascolarctobacterium caballi]